MESRFLSKCGSWLLILMMLLISIVGQIQSACIEEERRARLEIKASLHELSFYNVDNLLSTWVDHGNTSGECCDWERIKCDTTTGYVTHVSLSNMFLIEQEQHDSYYERIRPEWFWPLKFSPFLHFKELRSLDLSWNYIGSTIVSTGIYLVRSTFFTHK
ncbi:putative leucine-rich repeat-containing, plant-type, leucine-rich repeat domain superfamily [Helianthus annuus]|nr:putative leucine-rich repeat-containing, plant-type, leucine-rich repeat domain superfamily [Helianthus annuus]